MPDIHVSLIGLGRAGGFHLESIRTLPGVRLAQVHDLDAARTKEVAERTGCRVAQDVEEAVGAPDVDAPAGLELTPPVPGTGGRRARAPRARGTRIAGRAVAALRAGT